MSAERKKLLWISISACVFVLIVLAVGFFLFSPKAGGAAAPAAIGNSAAPKAQDPQDFLSAPPPPPALEQPRNQDGGVIIVYGDKPGQAEATATAGNATAATSATPAAPAAPAAAVTAAPAKAAPAAPAAKKAPTKSPTVKVDEYWIQAASFTSRGRADELKSGLAEKGVAALISVKDISGKSWYRVRIGPYSAKEEAEGWLGRLKGIPGCAEAYVSRTTATKPRK
jgi:DedD protein